VGYVLRTRCALWIVCSGHRAGVLCILILMTGSGLVWAFATSACEGYCTYHELLSLQCKVTARASWFTCSAHGPSRAGKNSLGGLFSFYGLKIWCCKYTRLGINRTTCIRYGMKHSIRGLGDSEVIRVEQSRQFFRDMMRNIPSYHRRTA
jgi:hypothetical protein